MTLKRSLQQIGFGSFWMGLSLFMFLGLSFSKNNFLQEVLSVASPAALSMGLYNLVTGAIYMIKAKEE